MRAKTLLSQTWLLVIVEGDLFGKLANRTTRKEESKVEKFVVFTSHPETTAPIKLKTPNQ